MPERPMALKERLELFAKIEEHRRHPLIVYVTSKRNGLNAQMGIDALPFLIEQLDRLPAATIELDFMIVSNGGDPMVAWRMMSLIRARGITNVSVLIPQSAYSAATLLALGANEIIMHPNGHLGPVDMQIGVISEGKQTQFSTEDFSAFIEFVKERLMITDQEHLRKLFERTCTEVGTLGVGFTARSSKLAVALGERLLGMHMTGIENEAKKRAVIENLSRQFHSHAYPVNRNEAIEMGVRVKKEQDITLEGLMWDLWLDLEGELVERSPFHPIIELLNSNQAAILLAPPVPQAQFNPQQGMTSMTTVPAAADPVGFQHVNALMESKRLAHQSLTKGVILAFRESNLSLQYNPLVSFRGWERTHSQ
jgi:hypothetical protein